MTETRKHQIDREIWGKWSFYIDIVVFIIIAIFIYLLTIDSYSAGTLELLGGWKLSQAWFVIARDVAFLAVGLTWIFFRLYKYRGELERRYR
jgi:hypothetical protein